MSKFVQRCQEGGFFRVPPSLSLRLTGNDRIRYLNGQVTANLYKLAEWEAIRACLLTPQGKLEALLSITPVKDALLLESELELSKAIVSRLERYIISDDVQIEVTETSNKVHFFGGILNHPILRQIHGTKINRLGVEGKDIELIKLESLMGLTFQESLKPELIEGLRISQGVPRWGYELEVGMLPQEAYLERTHIDDEKGCYVGQEVVSRLKSIGHVNRFLSGFITEGDIPLSQGMKIFSNNNPSQPIGYLTSVAKIDDEDGEKFIALGYLRRGHHNIDTQVTAIDPETEVVAQAKVSAFPL